MAWSSNTAYPDHQDDQGPTRRDFGAKHNNSNNEYGSGPGLIDPGDKFQRSDSAYNEHLDKAVNTVGPGPSLKPTGRSKSPEFGYAEHHEHRRRSSTLSSPVRDLDFDELGPEGSNDTTISGKSIEDIEHQHNLSSVRTHLGLEREAPVLEEHDDYLHSHWSAVRYVLREPFAEFFGTFIMVLFGNGGVAQVLLSGGQQSAPGKDGYGSYQSINWAWGIGAMLGIYVAGDSGGFLNPAVTFSFCVYRKLPWRRFPIYFLAQFLGGLCAAGVIYINYINAIDQVEGHGIRTVPPSPTATAGIFCTYPQAFLTKASQFFSEFIASTILMLVIFALKDDSNPGAMGKSGAGPMFPLALLFLIFGLGYAINLARDFGPRLMSYAVGYRGVWSAGEYYFWIPMVAPFCGCLFGGLLYDVFVYTGPESPVNKRWIGIPITYKAWRRRAARRSLMKRKETEGDDIEKGRR
ncbi:hypothetical protein CJF30_00005219 [Rutstroemia sp. NJR-2017a BBW]|nr:hypothetical protein CJF30_00005219 [Rutstroemia sp. NJR-2017a BBW]